MLTLSGTVMALLHSPERVVKGEKLGAYSQVQLQVRQPAQGGQFRFDMVTLTTTRPAEFERFVGEEVTVPVRAYVRGSAIAYALAPDDALPTPSASPIATRTAT